MHVGAPAAVLSSRVWWYYVCALCLQGPLLLY